MNIRTILFAGSMCLLTLSPLQATTPAINAVATVESKVNKNIDQLESVELPKKADATESSKDATSEKAVQSDMNRNVTMSVGTIIVILLLIIILL